MKPTISILNYIISSYRLFAVLATLIGLVLLTINLRKNKVDMKKILLLFIPLILFFFLGARFFNVFLNPKAYETISFFKLDFAGLSIYGGLIGALIAISLWTFILKIPLWESLDACVLPSGISFILARIGCFLNGCCGGKITSSKLGIIYPHLKDLPKPFSLPVWPTQLFELFATLLILTLLVFINNKKIKLPSGSKFLVFSFLFSLARLLILPYRRLPYSNIIVNWLYPGFYLFFIILSLTLFIYRMIKHNESEQIQRNNIEDRN